MAENLSSPNNSNSDENKFVIVEKASIPDQAELANANEHVLPTTSTRTDIAERESKMEPSKRGNSSQQTPTKAKRFKRDKIHVGTPWDPFTEAVCTTFHSIITYIILSLMFCHKKNFQLCQIIFIKGT